MRELRALEPNAIYHVTTRGARQQPIFRDALDFERYLSLLGDAMRRFDCKCFAYCLMPNHVHLILREPRMRLPEAMQRLNLRYAIRFNARYDYKGHAFDRRYWSDIVESDSHLLEAFRYVANNPVRAGLVESAAEWRWSSYSAVVAMTMQAPLLAADTLDLFGSLSRFREFVESPDPSS